MARKENARESKNYKVGPNYTIRSSNLTTLVYNTGGENACKEKVKSTGRKLIKLYNLKEVSVKKGSIPRKARKTYVELQLLGIRQQMIGQMSTCNQ